MNNQKVCEKLQKQFQDSLNLDLDSNYRLLKPLIKENQNKGNTYFTLPSENNGYLDGFQKILDKAKGNRCDLMTKFKRDDIKNLKEVYLSHCNNNKIFVCLENDRLIPEGTKIIAYDQVKSEARGMNSDAIKKQQTLVDREMKLMHICLKYGNDKQKCYSLLPYLLTC